MKQIKVDDTKSCFFEKIDKIDKPLDNLTKIKESNHESEMKVGMLLVIQKNKKL